MGEIKFNLKTVEEKTKEDFDYPLFSVSSLNFSLSII
jgi:hypothetical protein